MIEGETYINRTANVRNILGSMPDIRRPGDPGVNDQQTTPTTDPVRALENARRTLLQLVANIDAALAAIKELAQSRENPEPGAPATARPPAR